MSQIITENTESWRIEGELSFQTANDVLTEFLQKQQAQTPKVIDLKAITRTDSAGLALLIELIRQVPDNTLQFHNIPTQMLSIAKISGVEELLQR
jgi:phospholipid transport system transporter-binding protein